MFLSGWTILTVTEGTNIASMRILITTHLHSKATRHLQIASWLPVLISSILVLLLNTIELMTPVTGFTAYLAIWSIVLAVQTIHHIRIIAIILSFVYFNVNIFQVIFVNISVMNVGDGVLSSSSSYISLSILNFIILTLL